MKNLDFPTLRANDIECRIGTTKPGKGFSLLLYKDARCDMALLDKVVGPMNWQREHSIRQNYINGQPTMVNYCKVSIYDEDRNQWVSKEDVGTESNTENAKGESSDAFKRACFCWGIGRELYTAPFVWISTTDDKEKFKKFRVSEISYDADRNINHLVIVDEKGCIRFQMGKPQQKEERNIMLNLAGVDMVDFSASDIKKVCETINQCDNRTEFVAVLRAVMDSPIYKEPAVYDCFSNSKYAKAK